MTDLNMLLSCFREKMSAGRQKAGRRPSRESDAHNQRDTLTLSIFLYRLVHLCQHVKNHTFFVLGGTVGWNVFKVLMFHVL